jgi:pre-mRNA-splicing factor ATP-dependent RNA helicase DHX15/PRP43
VYHAYKATNMDSKWAWDNFVSDRALRQADNVRQQLMKLMQK